MITQPQWQMWWFPDKMNMSNSASGPLLILKSLLSLYLDILV